MGYGKVTVLPEERERLARLRLQWPDEDAFYRLRVSNQEGWSGEDAIKGCLNGKEFAIPREQDFLVTAGQLHLLSLCVEVVVTSVAKVENGEKVYELRQSRRPRFPVQVYGELDLEALEAELAAEAEEEEAATLVALQEKQAKKAAREAAKQKLAEEKAKAEAPAHDADKAGK